MEKKKGLLDLEKNLDLERKSSELPLHSQWTPHGLPLLPVGFNWDSTGSPLGVHLEFTWSLLGVRWEWTGSGLGVQWEFSGNLDLTHFAPKSTGWGHVIKI